MAENKIHLSSIYPCSRVSLSSELYYICELGKYLKVCGYTLSVDGIIFDSVLSKSKFWKYLKIAYTNGWVSDLGAIESELSSPWGTDFNVSNLVNILITEEEVEFDSEDFEKRNSDSMYDILTPKKVRTFFQNKNTSEWSWCIEGGNPMECTINSRGIKRTHMSQSFVSLVAYVAIHRLLTKTPERFRLQLSAEAVDSKFAVADVMLLSEESDALNSWFSYDFDCTIDLKKENKLGYLSWWYKGHEQGMLDRPYTAKEKCQYMIKLGLRPGSVIALYQRDPCQNDNMMKDISGFHYAIVRSVGKTGVVFEVVNTRFPFYTGYRWYKGLSMAVKQMYCGTLPYKTFNSSIKRFDWTDLGVEYMLYDELTFVTPIYQGDSKCIDILDDGASVKREVSAEDLIYWILKDYQVEFDEEYFLQMYFKDKEPVYNLYSHDEVKLSVRK